MITDQNSEVKQEFVKKFTERLNFTYDKHGTPVRSHIIIETRMYLLTWSDGSEAPYYESKAQIGNETITGESQGMDVAIGPILDRLREKYGARDLQFSRVDRWNEL